MKILSKIIGTFVLTFLLGTLQAQNVTLTFTGRDATTNTYVQLSRIEITDLTQGWTETLTFPDTVAILTVGTGIEESVANGGFGLSQNNPNPFTGTTDVNMTVADAGAVTLEIVDGNGKIVEMRHGTSLQSLKSSTTNPFTFGDQMEYVGYATINGTEYENDNAHIAKALAFTTGWNSSNNTCAIGNTPTDNNATGFSALPAGRYYGTYDGLGYATAFWSTTEFNSSHAYYRTISYSYAYVDRTNFNKPGGFSMRCVKD